MKKIIPFIILLVNWVGNAQCLAPSNLTVSSPVPLSAEIIWMESGTATQWEIVVIPDYYIGAPIPAAGIMANNNPFVLTNLPPGCHAFFVRSVCSSEEVSSWVAVGSSDCPINISNYLGTASNYSFSLDSEKREFQISPNPSKNIVQIKGDLKIDRLTISDSLGKVILIQTQNNTEVDVEKLSKGIYLIEIFSENERFYKKLVKE